MQCPVLAARKASSDWLHGMSLAMSVAASLLFIYMSIFRAWVPRKSYEPSSSSFWLPRPKLWRCLWVFFVTLCPIHQEILQVASVLHQYPLAWATIIPHRFLQQPLNWPSCFRLCSHTILSPCSSWWSFKILSQTLLLLWSKPSHISDLTQNNVKILTEVSMIGPLLAPFLILSPFSSLLALFWPHKPPCFASNCWAHSWYQTLALPFPLHGALFPKMPMWLAASLSQVST